MSVLSALSAEKRPPSDEAMVRIALALTFDNTISPLALRIKPPLAAGIGVASLPPTARTDKR